MVATAKALIEATAMLPKYRVLNVNALTLNNAGAYIYQELGYALAWGNEYMNQLTDAGLPAALVAKKIKFNLVSVPITSLKLQNSAQPYVMGQYRGFL